MSSFKIIVIIVTGGAGFIGSALTAQLNSQGEEDILIVDDMGHSPTGKWKNLVGLRFADYMDRDDFILALEQGKFSKGVKTLFHLGACATTTETDGAYLLKNNYEYTKTLAKFSISKNIRFIYASSAATYGDGTLGYSDNHNTLASLRPLNLYGYSKHLFDLWASRNGLLKKIVGLKYFNVFGPNEAHKGGMRSMVAKAFEQIVEKGRVQLFKSYRPEFPDGMQQRDFLYIKDAVAMTLFFSKNRASGIFNIGSGVTNSWNDMAHYVWKAMGRDPNIVYVEMPDAMRNAYQYSTCADITKLRKAGYKAPVTSLGDAVREYVQEYLMKGKTLSAS